MPHAGRVTRLLARGVLASAVAVAARRRPVIGLVLYLVRRSRRRAATSSNDAMVVRIRRGASVTVSDVTG